MGLILVVSEDLVAIETARTALSVHGWWATVAADGATALQVAAEQAPKIVVVDTEVPGAIDLLGTFSVRGGGPGVVTCVPEGLESSLELAEAGAEEILTKPLSSEGVLEAVQRALAAPRPSPAEPAAEPQDLLTTEDIFGDVLREIEEIEEVEVGVGADPLQVPEAPQPAVAAAEPFDSDPQPEPVVSLAGLFDDEREPDPEVVADPPAAESEWRGEERRSAQRPWSDPVPAASLEVLEVPPDATSTEQEVAELFAETEEPLGTEGGEEIEVEESEPPAENAAASRLLWPPKAVTIGALAATLLAAVGVVFVLNRGAAPVPEPLASPERLAPPEEVIELSAEAVRQEPALVEVPAAAEPTLVAAPAESAAAGASEGPSLASPPSPEPDEELEAFNLEAIVDQELERREAELRRVFLEEEKRLLRELNNLDPVEDPAESSGEDGADDRSGVGR